MEVILQISQIVSAIATSAAVIVAIWLSLRTEKQRPKFFIGMESTTTISPNPADCGTSYALALTIVNAGLLPIVIQNAHYRQELGGSDSWGCGLGSFDAKSGKPTFPIKLDHGEQVTGLVQITNDERPWRALSKYWWIWNRPKFIVTTTLGGQYVAKPGRRLLYRLHKDAIKARGIS